MITVTNLSLAFSGSNLFKDVNLKFVPGNCYGIIGANGAGKSTFLRILSGELEPSTGEVIIPENTRMSVLKQDHFAFNEYSVLDTIIMGNRRLYDVMKEKDALYMKDYTGCSSLMLARGTLGNPFLFGQIKKALAGQDYTDPDYKTRLLTARDHFELLLEDKGPRTGLLEARKHIAWYIKGMPGAPALRDRINRIEDAEELRAILCDQLIALQIAKST